MNCRKFVLSWFVAISLLCSLSGQQMSSAQSAVPHLVKFSGKAVDGQGKAISGTAGATFAIYKDQYGGAPLWLETQNIQADAKGNYAAQLGANKADGLPLDLFSSGEARWLGVTINGGQEQPRVLLLSVPYALKAGDADTLGGMPLSAFQLAPSHSSAGANNSSKSQSTAIEQTNEIVCSSGTACKTGFIPAFSSNGGSAAVIDSIISQSASNVTIHGSETISGSETVSNNVTAKTMTATAALNPVTGTMTGTGNSIAAITGKATASGSAGFTFGVMGSSASDQGRGVFGLSTGLTGVGVIGESNNGSIGVVGKSLPSSGVPVAASSIGVWGDANASAGTGVYGTGLTGAHFATVTNGTALFADAPDAEALEADNSSTTNLTGRFFNTVNPGGGPATSVLEIGGFDSIGQTAFCTFDNRGDMACVGTKSAVVPVDHGSRQVALYAIEGPENWFEDAGSAQLSNGEAVVHLESTFGQTVNTDVGYHVFLTPNGDCKGLYVTQKTATSFVVRELAGGNSSISFDYRIMAKRKGYEKLRLGEKTAEWLKLSQSSKRLLNGHAASTVMPRNKPKPARLDE